MSDSSSKHQNQPRVLLLGNDDRVILAVARGLGRNGIAVHVGWCEPESPALRSRYIAASHHIAAYRPDTWDWVNDLNRLVDAGGYELVIPCNDFAVVPLQFHRDRLTTATPWYLIDDQHFQITFDKIKSRRLAQSSQVPVPDQIDLTGEQIRSWKTSVSGDWPDDHDLNFPAFLKPVSSVTQDQVGSKRVACRVENKDELRSQLAMNEWSDGCVVQSVFRGSGVGVEVLAHEGNVLLQMQHRRLRETVDGGSTYRETIDPIPELTRATEAMVQKISYTGIAMFEYRYCFETKSWVFLEINARFWGSLPLAIASGINFPWALYQMLIKGRREFDWVPRARCRCRNLIRDLRAYRKQRDAAFGAGHLFTGRDHLDFFSIDDWRPQWSELVTLSKSQVARLVGNR